MDELSGVYRRPSVRGGARSLPGRYYTDPAVFLEEQERIFARHWVCVGRAEQVPVAGAYLEVQVAGESLLIVRGGDGLATAFFNVCRHRGTRFCTQGQGRFSCAIRRPADPGAVR
jgi:Rieske 2Fe-2S family protein